MAGIMEYLGMGGYAGYVWSAYAATALILLVLLIASQRLLRGTRAIHQSLADADEKNVKDGTVEEKT